MAIHGRLGAVAERHSSCLSAHARACGGVRGCGPALLEQGSQRRGFRERPHGELVTLLHFRSFAADCVGVCAFCLPLCFRRCCYFFVFVSLWVMFHPSLFSRGKPPHHRWSTVLRSHPADSCAWNRDAGSVVWYRSRCWCCCLLCVAACLCVAAAVLGSSLWGGQPRGCF